MSNFSEEMRRRRKLLNMTIRDVEAATGISNPMICQYEGGKCINLSFQNAILLSRLLDWKLISMARKLEKQMVTA